MAEVQMESIMWHTVDSVPYDVGATYPVDDVIHKVGEISLIETLEALSFAKQTAVAPPVTATGATAGAPGSFTPAGAAAPANLAAMAGITAIPATAWTTGQHVILGDLSHCHWNATTWTAGDAP
jgi:hypothetical protein